MEIEKTEEVTIKSKEEEGKGQEENVGAEEVTKIEENAFVSYDDFAKLDIRLGTIRSVEIVPEADRLLKLLVDFGEAELRQIVSGIRTYYENPTEELVGVQCPFIVNLEPRKIKGLVSHGMILAVNDSEKFSLLLPTEHLAIGTKIK